MFVIGCASKKDIIYNFDSSGSAVEQIFSNVSIDYGDVLDINISAINPESVMMFMRNSGSVQGNVQPENLKLSGYLVDDKGFIDFPVIGKVQTMGKTTSELSEVLKQEVSIYVKEPSVNVRLANNKITLIGEVRNPGTFTILEERIDILQAIGLAGDLTINANREQVKLLRRENNKITQAELSLIDGQLLNRPYFYLKQNDVLYFAPNTAKVKSSGLIGSAGTVATVLSLLLSFVVILGR